MLNLPQLTACGTYTSLYSWSGQLEPDELLGGVQRNVIMRPSAQTTPEKSAWCQVPLKLEIFLASEVVGSVIATFTSNCAVTRLASTRGRIRLLVALRALRLYTVRAARASTVPPMLVAHVPTELIAPS